MKAIYKRINNINDFIVRIIDSEREQPKKEFMINILQLRQQELIREIYKTRK
jgi:hypothetical protein